MTDKKKEENVVETPTDTIQRHKKVAEALQEVGGKILEFMHKNSKGVNVDLEKTIGEYGIKSEQVRAMLPWHEQARKFLTTGVDMERVAMGDYLGIKEDESEVERLGAWLVEKFPSSLKDGEGPVDAAIRLMEIRVREPDKGTNAEEIRRLENYLASSSTPLEWGGGDDDAHESATVMAIRLLKKYRAQLRDAPCPHQLPVGPSEGEWVDDGPEKNCGCDECRKKKEKKARDADLPTPPKPTYIKEGSDKETEGPD